MTHYTSLYICRGIPWNSDYSHVRLFASANAANTYIISKAAYTKTQYSYISKSKQIRVDGMADQYRDCIILPGRIQDILINGFMALLLM